MGAGQRAVVFIIWLNKYSEKIIVRDRKEIVW
jgi:hypothetical protein